MVQGPADNLSRFVLLLVDDHDADRLAVQAAVEEESRYRVTACRTAADALRALLHTDFCLALVDLHLPDMHGLELARAIKARERSKFMPVVFITATDDLDSIEEAYAVGGADYLTKPVRPEILRAKIAIYIELHQRRLQLEKQTAELEADHQLELARGLAEAKADAERRFRTIAEQETRRAEQLYEDAMRAVRIRDTFLLVAAHELRTPLTTVQLALQHLERTAQPFADAAQLATAIRQVRRLSRLVDDLVDVGRLGEGRLQVRPEPLDVTTVVRHVAHEFEELATVAASPLLLQVTDGLHAEVDPARFEQLLGNLLSNALKYGRGKPVVVRLAPADGKLRLEVEDEGIGVPVEDRQRIFERFERAVSERAYGGLGLGLYISKQIVEAHGGKIRVESTDQRGSRFVVDLPVEAARPTVMSPMA
jgi:signal transduction histidine kinase